MRPRFWNYQLHHSQALGPTTHGRLNTTLSNTPEMTSTTQLIVMTALKRDYGIPLQREADKRSDRHSKTRDEQPSQRALRPSPGKNSSSEEEPPVHCEVRETFETNDEPVRVGTA